jgi:hypothetical protein
MRNDLRETRVGSSNRHANPSNPINHGSVLIHAVYLCSMQTGPGTSGKTGWQAVEALLEERFGKVPDMEGTLFLIGVNEFGREAPRGKFTKEQKQDLMHIAVCTLLSQLDYYRFIGRDEEGWPHFENVMPVPTMAMGEQEAILKACIVHYFGLDDL